jgi:hypothetical protein
MIARKAKPKTLGIVSMLASKIKENPRTIRAKICCCGKATFNQPPDPRLAWGSHMEYQRGDDLLFGDEEWAF